MYLHIGKGLILNKENIVAILNIDYIKKIKEYKKFYQKLLEEEKIINIANGNEKTLILVNKNNETKAYISNINSNTIVKRKL